MEIWACETVTGRKLATLPFTSHQWETIHNGAGSVDVTVPLRKLSPRRRAEVKSYLEPVRCSLAAVTDNGDVLEAGPIWRGRFNDKTGDLTMGASGLWSVFDKRKLVHPSWEIGQRVQDTTVALAGTYEQIASTLIAASMARTGGTLPILGDGVSAGGPANIVREYPGYEMKWVGDALRELTQVSGGPDIAFQPRVRADGLGIEWVFRVGGPMLTQAGDDWLWDRGAPRAGLLTVDVDIDATGMGQRAWAIGNGSDTGFVLGVAENPAPFAAGFPLTEVDAPVSTVQAQTQVNEHALSALKVAQRPWNSWVITARNRQPDVGLYRPGDWAKVVIPSTHEFLPPGTVRTRIMSIAGNRTRTVTVRVAPVMEAR